MTINKKNIETDIWNLIYNRTKTVTSITNSDDSTQTIQTYASSFPDNKIDSKSTYPIVIVNPLDMNWTDFTQTKKQVNGTFTIDVYSTKSESADRFRQAIIEAIETYRETLRGLGMDFVNLDNTLADSVNRGGFKVHLRSAIFSWRFRITKTYS